MPEKKTLDFTVVPYSAQYKEQTLKMLGLLWTGKNDEQCREYFQWKYVDNPYTTTPLIFLAVYSGKVIGILGHVVLKFVINGKVQNICTPVDGIVDPDYRMYGVYLRLTSESLQQISMMKQEYDFKLFFNASSNPGSAPGLVKMGWKELGAKGYMFRLSITNTILAALHLKPIKGKLDSTKMIDQDCRLDITNDIRSAELQAFNNTKQYPINNVRDQQFYQWRFGYQKERFVFVYLYKQAELMSYLVLRNNGANSFSIEEYGYHYLSSLKIVITHTMRLLSIRLLRLFRMHQPDNEQQCLVGMGFVSEQQWLLKLKKIERTPAYVRHVDEPASPTILINGVDCMEYSNWRVFHSDVL